jgi:hypothetical protein
MGKRLRALVVLVAVLSIGIGPLAESRADPVCVDAEVTREQDTSIDPLGPPKCQWTPWQHMMTVDDGDRVSGLPPGAPNGYEVFIDLPAPEPP